MPAMALPFPNLYHKRLVADSARKPCYICHTHTATVLITPDQVDFFYTCPGHLKDQGFAIPQGPSAEELEAERLRKEAEKEVEEKKKLWREKEKEKEKEKKNGKDKKEDGENGEKKKDEENKKDEPKKDEPKKEDPTTPNGTAMTTNGETRVFTLQKKIFDMRVNRLRQLQIAKKNAERLRDPTALPSVPKGDPV